METNNETKSGFIYMYILAIFLFMTIGIRLDSSLDNFTEINTANSGISSLR